MNQSKLRVANLASLKPDFEIVAFFNALGFFQNQQTGGRFFLKIKKARQNLFFFHSETALTLPKHCLSCMFITVAISSDESL